MESGKEQAIANDYNIKGIVSLMGFLISIRDLLGSPKHLLSRVFTKLS